MTFWVFHLNSWPKLAEIPSMVLHDVVLSENTWRIWRDREIQGMSAHFRGLSIHYPDTWAFHCHPYPDYWKIAIHHILSFKERRKERLLERIVFSEPWRSHNSRKQEKNLSSTFFRVFTYFWKGKSLDAARSSEGETVTADFLPNLGELQGELGAEPDPTEPSDGVALDPKLS